MYLTVLIVSNPVLAANNKGEGTGNIQTLQQITTPTGTRTVLSGVAIKRAMRDNMLANDAPMWRQNDNSDPIKNPAGYAYGKNKSPAMIGAEPKSPIGYADEQFGFMIAPKGKAEQIMKKKGVCEVSTAISTTNYTGDFAFGQGLKADKPQLNPFQSERHFTRYQYTVTWDLSKVDKKSFEAAASSLRCLAVGGSHSSNATEITPDSIIWSFHKAPGRAGLHCGIQATFPPDEDLNLDSIYDKALQIGVGEYHRGQYGKGVMDMVEAAAEHCKG